MWCSGVGHVSGTASGRSGSFDVSSNLRLVPEFCEWDPDTFFSLFERVAESREWSDSEQTMLLRCVFTGKAQEAYSALTVAEGTVYATVKAAVLWAEAAKLADEYVLTHRGSDRGSRSIMLMMIWVIGEMVSFTLKGKIQIVLALVMSGQNGLHGVIMTQAKPATIAKAEDIGKWTALSGIVLPRLNLLRLLPL